MKLSLRDTRVVAPCCNIAVLCCRAAPLSCSAAAFCCWSDRISFSAALTAGSPAIEAGAAACGNRSPKLSNFGKALAKYAAAAAPPTTKADKEATTISLVLYRLGARGSSSSCVSVFSVSACDLCALSATVLTFNKTKKKERAPPMRSALRTSSLDRAHYRRPDRIAAAAGFPGPKSQRTVATADSSGRRSPQAANRPTVMTRHTSGALQLCSRISFRDDHDPTA